MLSRLSGNDPLWQGKYGAQRYQQMTSGMQNATSLSNVSQLLMYQAAKGINNSAVQKYGVEAGSPDDWLNGMVMLESGDLSLGFMKALKGGVEGAYGGDRASRIKTYMEQFGLNYTGGIAVDKMMQNLDGMTDKQISDQIAKYKADPSMKSDNTRMQDVMSKLDGILTKMGANAFGIKLAGLEKIEETTNNIYNFMTRNSPIDKKIAGQLFDLENGIEAAEFEGFSNNPVQKARLQSVAYDLTPEEMSIANANDYIQDFVSGKLTKEQFLSKVRNTKVGQNWNYARNSGLKYDSEIGPLPIKDLEIDQIENQSERNAAIKSIDLAGAKIKNNRNTAPSIIKVELSETSVNQLISEFNRQTRINIYE